MKPAEPGFLGESLLQFEEWPVAEVEQPVPRRFERMAALYPDRIAITSPSGHLTYGELNCAANRIAHELIGKHRRAGRVVALLMAQESPLFAGILGALKAGRICVVLSPRHPPDLIGSLLEECETGVILADDEHFPAACSLSNIGRVVIHAERHPEGSSFENPRVETSPDDPAFIIYTSGSTGRPAGVVQNHRNVLHNIRRHTHGLRLCASDRIAMLSSASHGQGLATAFSALLNGAVLCLRELARGGAAGLAGWINEEKITVLPCAASVFRNFSRSLQKNQTFPSVRIVRLASEPVNSGDYDLFRRHFPATCLFANFYSSTETGNLCQFFAGSRGCLRGEVVPVGRPVEGIEIFLLDENDREAAPGQVGEIMVKSRYLSPGYWKNRKRTEVRFLECAVGGERIYRTGDLGRFLPDGQLQHLGRKDFLLKIRGFLVNPEEVAERLRQHAGIEDAVVDSRPGAGGVARLVAYIVPNGGSAPAPAELRRHLGGTQPDFMIPSVFYELPALPRTPNGKVDRQALRLMNLPASSSAVDSGVSRSHLEELLAEIWSEVLDTDAVGVEENFFEVGGDSLLVTQLCFRIEEALEIALPASLPFEHPTIASMAAAIGKLRGFNDRVALAPLTAQPRGRPLPASYAQERTWKGSQTPAGSIRFNIANLYTLDGPLNRNALSNSLDELVRRHEIFRTSFKSNGERLEQIINPPSPVGVEFIDLSSHQGAWEEVMRLVGHETLKPFDLSGGPMLRATLARLGERRHALILAYHHIIFDERSQEILLRELAILYSAALAGHPSPLPPAGLQFADFAAWQRRWMVPGSPHFQAQVEYWLRQLEGVGFKTKLPFARIRRLRNPLIEDCSQSWGISGEATQKLLELGRREKATLFMISLAAFAALLHRLTGSVDIVIGSNFTNRTRAELWQMPGFFVNVVALRIKSHGDPEFRELVARVRRMVIETAAHSEIPFDLLRKELRRSNLRPPAIQTHFDFKNNNESPVRCGDLEIRRLTRKPHVIPWGFQLICRHLEGGLTGTALFDSGLHHPVKVARFLRSYEILLCDAAFNPEKRLSRLRIKPSGSCWWRPLFTRAAGPA